MMTSHDTPFTLPGFEDFSAAESEGRDGFWLTTIRLHNWHAVPDHTIRIPLGNGLHLEGATGVGKTTIMDAILWALIGDQRLIRFNAAASSEDRGRGGRKLEDYLRWSKYDHQYAREQGTTFVLLEFTHIRTREQVTVGSVIDFTKDGSYRPFFMVCTIGQEEGMLVNPSRSYYYGRELRAAYTQKYGKSARVVDNAAEYRDLLMRQFEGLPMQFFTTISHLSGQHDPSSLDELIRENLFAKDPPITLEGLAEQVIQYRQVREDLSKARERLDYLDPIQKRHTDLLHHQQQEAIYRIVEVFARGAICRQNLEDLEASIASHEEARQDTEARLAELRVEVPRAEKAHNELLFRLNSDYRSWEIKQLDDKLADLRVELKRLQVEAEDQEKILETLSGWLKVAPGFLSQVAVLAGGEPPVGTLESMGTGLTAEPVDAPAVQSGLLEVGEWVAGIHSRTEDCQSEERRVLLQYQEQLAGLRVGRLPEAGQAYQVQEALAEDGEKVALLCDLIDSVDPDWQPMVERMLGPYRFSLVAELGNYSVCLSRFLKLPANQVEGIYLIDPRHVDRYRSTTRGSLAARVVTRHPIVRAVLNARLNRWITYERDEDAARADRDSVSKNGIVHSSLFVERRAPMPASRLAFGRVARERQAQDLSVEVEAGSRRMEQIRVQLEDLARLKGNLQQMSLLAASLRPEVPARLIACHQSLQESETRLAKLVALGDFVELERQIATAKAWWSDLVGEKSRKEDDIQSIEKEMVELRGRVRDFKIELDQNEMEFLDRSPDQLDWRQSFDDLLREWGSLTQVQLQSGKNADHHKSLFSGIENDLRLWMERYFKEYSPPESLGLDFDERLNACLREHTALRDTRVGELRERLLQLKATADKSLLHKFFGELRIQHKQIETNLRMLNRAVDGVRLGRRHYRFVHNPIKTQIMGDVLRLKTRFDQLNSEQDADPIASLSEESEGLIERLYQLFVPSAPLSAADQKDRDALLDPSRYFLFDLEVSESDAIWFPLSSTYRKGSGGEHQNPLYIILAATMLQFYENHPLRPRLVIIDEAFSKGPNAAVSGIELLLNQGLQPIVATPVGRPEVEETIGNTMHVYKGKDDAIRIVMDQVVREMVSRKEDRP